MSWTWRLQAPDGAPVSTPTGQAAPTHQTRSDAETWIGEVWRSLVDEGAAAANLLNEGQLVYGPMPLAE